VLNTLVHSKPSVRNKISEEFREQDKNQKQYIALILDIE